MRMTEHGMSGRESEAISEYVIEYVYAWDVATY